MCSYQIWRDTAAGVPSSTVSSLGSAAPSSPYAASGQHPQTWPVNESHYSCQQPLTLTYILRDMWGSGFGRVGLSRNPQHVRDYAGRGPGDADPGGLLQRHRHPHHVAAGSAPPAAPATAAPVIGNLCCSRRARSTLAESRTTSKGRAASGCPNTYGCPLVDSVVKGNLPLAVFNQSLARVLYEEQRVRHARLRSDAGRCVCTNPGGVGTRAGRASRATCRPDAAPRRLPIWGRRAVTRRLEKESEEGATLLKNDGNALPITGRDLAGGVLVTGSGAEHTIADPDRRGLDRVHRPRPDQPAATTPGLERRSRRVHVRARRTTLGGAGAHPRRCRTRTRR